MEKVTLELRLNETRRHIDSEGPAKRGKTSRKVWRFLAGCVQGGAGIRASLEQRRGAEGRRNVSQRQTIANQRGLCRTASSKRGKTIIKHFDFCKFDRLKNITLF